MMARLHVGHAGGLIAVQRNDLIGDHVLRGFHAVEGAADTFDPVIGLDTLWRAAHGRRRLGLDLVSETGAEQRPVACIHACGVTELHLADGGAVEQTLHGAFVGCHGATYSATPSTRQVLTLRETLWGFIVPCVSLIGKSRGLKRGSWPLVVRHAAPPHTPLTPYSSRR